MLCVQIADGLQGREKAEILQLCAEVQRLSDKLADLCMSGQGDSDEARAITRYTRHITKHTTFITFHLYSYKRPTAHQTKHFRICTALISRALALILN
jgi:hypothetical protein